MCLKNNNMEKLTHPFLFRCHNIDELLKDVHKISTFCRHLEQQSVLFPDRYDTDKYKGDGLELFVEASWNFEKWKSTKRQVKSLFP